MDEQQALHELRRGKEAYRRRVRFAYEHAAQDCVTCTTPGACCRDAHFVNVHITRLEALAIREKLHEYDDGVRRDVAERAAAAIARYNLHDEGDTYAQTYACPLFAPGVGCLVHEGGAKPAPCIQHACYERGEDLPPLSLQARMEAQTEQLNEAAYGADWRWRAIPLWLQDDETFNFTHGADE
jgi:hypothetical protein